MSDPSQPSMLRLPNGNFIYPLKYKSITAFREGSLPNLCVVLECVKAEGDADIERIECETYELVDAVGRVFAESMAKYFPTVPVSFREGNQ